MVKLTVLYGHPKDAAHFERYYRETHTPIAAAHMQKVLASPDGQATAPTWQILQPAA
jgi:hypothetical protein